MSEVLIRAQVKAILSGVSGIGVVHDYERWATNWTKYLELFSTGGRINGWQITRKKTSAVTASVTHDSRKHTFLIRGIYGLKDSEATEITFQALIESVCAAFRSKYQLNDTADNTEPVQVDLVENRVFGNVLCHFCELTLIAEEYENWS
ncbi:MAG: hypothetical protein JRD05_00745 [Deltaproteobacteria bacterium]|nr:hypothetical protein [Deltaproteobacteria bacterium]